MKNLFLYVGLRHLTRKPIRTLLTTLGIAFGIALFVAIRIINYSVLQSFKNSIESISGKASLTITAGELGFPEDRLDLLSKVPGVRYTAPMIEQRAYLADQSKASVSAETVVILGIDLLKEQSFRTYKTTDEHVIDDPLTFLNQPDSIIVTHSFAKKHDLKIDSRFELSTSTGKKSFTVRGLLSPEGPAKAYGGSIAIMDIDGARMTFGKENKTDRIDIVTKDGTDTEAVAAAIREKLGPGYEVERPATRSVAMERLVKSFQVMLTFFSTLALLVGLFLVTNSVAMAVAERKKEIGTLRALGATRSSILILFLTESVAMGAIGSFLGSFLGRGLASFMVKLVAASMTNQYMIPVEVSRLHFTPQDIGLAVLLGAITSLGAAFWPSYRATLIQPLEAMRRQEVGEGAQKQGAMRYAPVAGVVFLGLGWLYSVNSGTLIFPQFDRLVQGMGILGAALIGPTMVASFLRLLAKASSLFSKKHAVNQIVPRLARDNLLKNPMRTGSNVMSLMIGLLLVVMLASVNSSFRTTLDRWIERDLKADLLVSSTGRLISFEVQPLQEDLIPLVNTVPGIYPPSQNGAYGIRFMHLQYEGKRLAIKAFDPPPPHNRYEIFDALDRNTFEAGKELFESPTPTVMISDNFALKYGKKTGEILKVPTPSGIVEARIVGIAKDFASDEGVLYFNRKWIKEYWKDSLISAIGVQVMKGVDPQVVRTAIDLKFGKERNLMVTSASEMRKQLMETVDQSFGFARAIEGAALLVGLLGLLNTLLISVLERTREIGMLRAVGMTQKQLSRMILLEALLQGFFGAIAAIGLGSWISHLWVKYTLVHLMGYIIDFYFPWEGIWLALLSGIGVAAFAGFFPARNAARLEIREALDYE
jgi:putative ABC transport system permease protein